MKSTTAQRFSAIGFTRRLTFDTSSLPRVILPKVKLYRGAARHSGQAKFLAKLRVNSIGRNWRFVFSGDSFDASRRELRSTRWAVTVFIVLTSIAYLMAMAVWQVGSLFT